MTNEARMERERLSALFERVGPDAPTLCEGWTTRDLAAHLVLREGRPDAAIGVIAKPFASYTAEVQGRIAAEPWEELVERVRTGPPRWSPTRVDAVDRAVNTIEFFVHHEDVRRAVDGWEPRDLDEELVADLRAALGRMAKLIGRRCPVGLVLVPTDATEPIHVKKGSPIVTVRGPIGELVLFVYGRQDHAQVELDGPDDAVAAVRATSFGI